MRLFASSLFLAAAQALLVPPPPGPYAVAVKHIELIDASRIDPFAPGAGTKRRFMASAYLPIDVQNGCEPYVVPYMPPLTANAYGKVGVTLGLPQDMLAKFEMEFCNISSADVDMETKKKEFPVAVLSPGLNGSRFLYGALARSLASLGYIIFTVDHTYDALVVEFPDGSAAYSLTGDLGANTTLNDPGLENRIGDMSFVVSQLSNKTLTNTVFANFPGTFNPEKVAVYGHSYGGATAANVAQRDCRVIGGLNFDGTVFGAVNHEGFKGKPFVLVSRDVNSTSVALWDQFYSKVDAAKMELEVKGTAHYAFMDLPLLLTMYPLPSSSQAAVAELFGTLDGNKVEQAVNEIMVGLLELLFNNRTSPLKHVGNNPNVNVLRSDLVMCQ